MGQITQLGRNIGGTNYDIAYTYNAAGQVATMTYPSGKIVTYEYDSIGRLSKVKNGGADMLTIPAGSGYNAAGQPLSVSYGNGVTGTYSYNNNLQLASLRYQKPDLSDLLNLAYEYAAPNGGNNGQISKIRYFDAPGTQVLSKTEVFQYDAWSRLANAQTQDTNNTLPNTWALTWQYDRYGNRLKTRFVVRNRSQHKNPSGTARHFHKKRECTRTMQKQEVNRKTCRRFMLLVFCGGVSFVSANSQGQMGNKVSVSGFTYEKILAIIFPGPGRSLEGVDERIALRFTPNSGPESQIVIAKTKIGNVEIVRYVPRLKDGIYAHLEELRSKVGAEDASEMAKLVEIDKQVVSLPSSVKSQLYTEYRALRIPLRFETRVMIDAQRYELWGDTVSNHAYLSLSGSHYGRDKADHPLVRWMARIRDTVEKASKSNSNGRVAHLNSRGCPVLCEPRL